MHKNGLNMRTALVRSLYDVNLTWDYAFCISQHVTGICDVRHQRVKSHCACNGNYQYGLITTTVCYKNMLLSLFFPSIGIIPRIPWVSIKNSEWSVCKNNTLWGIMHLTSLHIVHMGKFLDHKKWRIRVGKQNLREWWIEVSLYMKQSNKLPVCRDAINLLQHKVVFSLNINVSWRRRYLSFFDKGQYRFNLLLNLCHMNCEQKNPLCKTAVLRS